MTTTESGVSIEALKAQRRVLETASDTISALMTEPRILKGLDAFQRNLLDESLRAIRRGVLRAMEIPRETPAFRDALAVPPPNPSVTEAYHRDRDGDVCTACGQIFPIGTHACRE